MNEEVEGRQGGSDFEGVTKIKKAGTEVAPQPQPLQRIPRGVADSPLPPQVGERGGRGIRTAFISNNYIVYSSFF